MTNCFCCLGVWSGKRTFLLFCLHSYVLSPHMYNKGKATHKPSRPWHKIPPSTLAPRLDYIWTNCCLHIYIKLSQMFYDLLLQKENQSKNLWIIPRLITLLLLTPTSPSHTFKNRGSAHAFFLIQNQMQVRKKWPCWKLSHQSVTIILINHHTAIAYTQLYSTAQFTSPHLNSTRTLLDCQKVSMCSSLALHAAKIKDKPLGFCSHTVILTPSKQGVPHPFPLGLLQDFLSLGISCQMQWELLLRGQDLVTFLVLLWWIQTPPLGNVNTREEHCWPSF